MVLLTSGRVPRRRSFKPDRWRGIWFSLRYAGYMRNITPNTMDNPRDECPLCPLGPLVHSLAFVSGKSLCKALAPYGNTGVTQPFARLVLQMPAEPCFFR